MLSRRLFTALLMATAVFPFGKARAAKTIDNEDLKGLVESTPPVPLPKDIAWETNNDEPLIGSPNAIRGGTFNLAMPSYPLTFRLVGPNSNDAYAAFNRMFAMMDKQGGLVTLHPTTDKFIPMLATHWSIQKDQRTIYFKLDRDARYSDGHPVTANDYVFTWRMMQSKHIIDPYYNMTTERLYESVDRIDDYTLRVVGTRPSWRPLYDYVYASLWPTPSHATVIDKDWVNRTTNQPLIVPGPYVISETERGVSITLKRVPNWWGDKKRYFIGQYNFDQIHVRIIPQDRELDYVRQGELDITLVPSKIWNEGLDFPAVQNGWLRRARTFVESAQGIHGLEMNLEAPKFQNRDFRIAVHHLLNFDRVNQNLLYGQVYRMNSFFEGTEFANPAVRARPFDPAKAHEHLERAGYRRPSANAGRGWGGKLVNAVRGLIAPRSDSDDIYVDDKGEKASFTVIYSAKAYERPLTVIQQDFRRAGVDMQLQMLDSGTRFERALERKYEMLHLLMTANFYPDPRQYLHSEFKPEKNNNNFWGFGNEEVDRLIKIFEDDLDPAARRDAMYRMDQIIHDEAFHLPLWNVPYFRLVHWDYLQFPDFYLPKRTEQYIDWLVYWIDPAKKAALEGAMRENKPLPVDPEIDKDYFGVKKKFQ